MHNENSRTISHLSLVESLNVCVFVCQLRCHRRCIFTVSVLPSVFSRQCSSSSHIFLFCFFSCVRCRFYINLVCICTLYATWRLFIIWNGRLFDPIVCNVVCILMASRKTLAANNKNTHMQTVREEARRVYVFLFGWR